MSLLNVVKCDACGKIHELGPVMIGGTPGHWYRDVPSEWYSLLKGNPQAQEPWNFCSAKCVGDHLQVPAQPAEAPQEQPACKVRRFLLVDGETTEITEGVKWASGWVSVDPATEGPITTWIDWEVFKRTHEGSGIQWIDQEAKREIEEKAVELTRWNGQPLDGWGER